MRHNALRHVEQAVKAALNFAVLFAALLADFYPALFSALLADFYPALFSALLAANHALFKPLRSVMRSEFFHNLAHIRLLPISDFFPHCRIRRLARYVRQKRQNFARMAHRALRRKRKIAISDTPQTLRDEFELAAQRVDFRIAEPCRFDYIDGIIGKPRFRLLGNIEALAQPARRIHLSA